MKFAKEEIHYLLQRNDFFEVECKKKKCCKKYKSKGNACKKCPKFS